MVSTPHFRATLGALDILKAGGNAIDAAVAAAALLGVVDPTQTGIGGDCFILYQPGGRGEVVALNGSGWAPQGVSTADYLARGITAMPAEGPQAVTIPGAIAAWERIVRDYGKLGFGRVLQPAIDAAEAGVPVAERVARDWKRKEAKLARNAAAARLFLPGGVAPAKGTVHRQPELARALRSLATEGTGAFYNGWIAEEMVATLRALGGSHVLDDFAAFAPEYVTPVRAAYRGREVWQCPPNGVGTVVLMMLRALERFDLAGQAPLGVERLHLLGEIGRLAYAARGAVLGDPRTGTVPLDHLLSDGFAAALAGRFSPERRLAGPLTVAGIPNHRDTVSVSIVDRDLNIVSLINSNFDDFGSGIVTENSGIVLQNRGCGFVIQPGHPNTIEGRKRPVHTIIPGLVTEAGQGILSFAVTGGQYQPCGQVEFLAHLFDDGMALQQAIEQPRFFSREADIELERGFSDAAVAALSRRGYNPVPAAEPLGTAQAVFIDRQTGVLHGAADSRRDGVALGW